MATDDRTYYSPGGTIALAVLPGISVQAIRGKATRDDLECMLPMLDHPVLGDRYVQLCRLAPTGVKDAPDDEFRNLAAQSIKQRSGRLVAFAYVVIGEGFLASIARAVITGLNAMIRPKHAEKVFSDPLAAATWLAEQMPPGSVVPTEVVAALDELVDGFVPEPEPEP